jgi:hypothetical protein
MVAFYVGEFSASSLFAFHFSVTVRVDASDRLQVG